MTNDKFQKMIEEVFDDEEVLVDSGEDLKVQKTGCMSLDVSLGIGGIPVGRIVEIYGPEGSGKTSIALSISKRAVEEGKRVLYIDVEKFLDYNVVESILGIGLPEKSFVLAKGNSAEDNFMIAEAGINSGEFDVIIFDSIGALAPKKEQEDDFGDQNIALVPRLLSKFLRRNAYTIRANHVAFIFINQVRDKVGSFFAQGYSTPGGHAIKHFASIIISLTKGKELKKGDNTFGVLNTFSVRKNKLAPPFRSYQFPIVFGIGVDYLRDLLDFSTMLGVVKKAGPYYKLEETTIGKGTEDSMRALADPKNKLVLDKIEKMVYTMTRKPSRDLVDTDESVEELIDEEE